MKKRTLRRRIGNWLFYSIVVLLVLIGALVWLTDTTTGFKTLLKLTSPILSRHHIEITGKVDGTLYDANISSLLVSGQKIEKFRFQWKPAALLKEQLIFTDLEATLNLDNEGLLPLKLTGKVNLRGQQTVDIKGNWRLKQSDNRLKGDLNVEGTLNQYRLQLKTHSRLSDKHFNLRFEATGSTKHLTSTLFKIRAADYHANGSLTLNFSPFSYHLALKSTTPKKLKKEKLIKFNVDSTGDSNAQQAHISFSDSAWHAKLQIDRKADGHITIDKTEFTTPAGPWTMPTTSIVVNGKNIDADNVCLSQDKAHICLTLHSTDKTLSGSVTTNINSLSQFSDFAPEVNNLAGSLNGKMGFKGSWDKLSFDGKLSLSKAQIGLPEYGLVLTKINADITSVNTGTMKIQAEATSGTGTIKTVGVIAYKKGLTSIVLSVNGKHFTAVNLPVANVVVSPSLVYTQNEKERVLTGVVAIDSAKIDADKYRAQAAKLNPDIVFVNNRNKVIKTDEPLPFALDIYIDTGDHTTFSGFGVNTKITGKVNVFSNNGTLIQSDGRLKITDGSYSAYGKRFDISKGELVFLKSPLTNPSLDIYADYDLTSVSVSAQSVNEIKVGVHVSGTVKNVKLTLYSDPPMTQENILSYIITGAPLDQAGPGAASALSQAAVEFASGGGDKSVLDEVKDSLSLNQLRVGSLNTTQSTSLSGSRSSSDPDSNNTAVFVGKALSDKFYVSYGVGLFNQQQIFQTHYQLSTHWAIKTNNSTLDSGADIVYTIEH